MRRHSPTSFSRRTDWDRTPNRLAQAVEERRASGLPLLDLRCSNPTACGLVYGDAFYRDLFKPVPSEYEPEAKGLFSAREAIGGYYRERGLDVQPENTWLGAGTSELYAQLLALLCDPGDAVLVPSPGYPLLDYIADHQGVRLVPYPLVYDGRWSIDLGALDDQLNTTDRVKALILVSPNNPTGHVLRDDEYDVVVTMAEKYGLALILDEVFADYPLDAAKPVFLPAPEQVTSFRLSGLSKVAALPQLKLSWGILAGPTPEAEEALARLELLADTSLSVSTPVQQALPRILAASPEMQRSIENRCRTNLAALRSALDGSAASVLHIDAGWSALVRLPQLQGRNDEEWALGLLEQGLWIQPAYLFGLPEGVPLMVTSLLVTKPAAASGYHVIRDHVMQIQL